MLIVPSSQVNKFICSKQSHKPATARSTSRTSHLRSRFHFLSRPIYEPIYDRFELHKPVAELRPARLRRTASQSPSDSLMPSPEAVSLNWHYIWHRQQTVKVYRLVANGEKKLSRVSVIQADGQSLSLKLRSHIHQFDLLALQRAFAPHWRSVDYRPSMNFSVCPRDHTVWVEVLIVSHINLSVLFCSVH